MESATLKLPRPSRSGNTRAYIAGGGATAALVAAAVIVFLGVAAFVGFNGLPFAADDAPDSTVNLAAGVPEAAADAAAPTAAAVAADPATPGPAALEEILASLPPGELPNFPGIESLIPGAGGDSPTVPGTIPPGTGGETPTSPGTLGTVVGGVEDTTGDLGVNAPLTDLTQGVTGAVDKTLNDTLNGVGGAVGNNQLGNQVTNGVNQATNNLLGPNGVGGLLGGG